MAPSDLTLHDTYDQPYVGWCLQCGGIASEVMRSAGLRSHCCGAVVLECDPLCKRCGVLSEMTEDRLCPDCQEDTDDDEQD